jgi:putative transcriptional regulator
MSLKRHIGTRRFKRKGADMTTKARDKIAAELREAIAVARGEEEPARIHKPQEIDVKAIRKKTGMSRGRSAEVISA